MIKSWRNQKPTIGKGTFVAESAVLIGDVAIGNSSSIWYGVVLRADVGAIVIGDRTSIQDGSMLHVDYDNPLVIGDDVTVGHGAILHSAKVGSGSLIGMGAIVLDAEIGANCLVGAGALIPPKKKYPANSLILGSPAKVIRELSEEELEGIRSNKDSYVRLATEYLKEL